MTHKNEVLFFIKSKITPTCCSSKDVQELCLQTTYMTAILNGLPFKHATTPLVIKLWNGCSRYYFTTNKIESKVSWEFILKYNGGCRRLHQHSSLLCCHFQQVLFVDLEEPPSLFTGQVRSTSSFVEVDRWFIPLCYQEVHTAAATLHGNLEWERKNAQWHFTRVPRTNFDSFITVTQ